MTIKTSARLLVVGLAAAVALPFSAAPATEHCANPVNLLSGAGLLLNPRTAGCDVIAEDFPETPGDDSNSDWIMPGATQGIVRWDEGSEPVDGVRDQEGIVTGSRIDIDGVVTALRFTPGTGLDGAPAAFFDSQAIGISRTASLTAVATITVCRDEVGEDCETAVYRGIAAV